MPRPHEVELTGMPEKTQEFVKSGRSLLTKLAADHRIGRGGDQAGWTIIRKCSLVGC